MKVARVSEMRSLDKTASQKFGITEQLLMENAGEAVYFAIQREMTISGKKFIIFCGAGNNGGDGFVAARKLHSNGGLVKVIAVGDPRKLRGAAKQNFDIISKTGIEILKLESVDSIRTEVAHSDVIVDALFGTGLAREVDGIYRDAIDLINGFRKTVISVDIPSGISGDTGAVLGNAVRADFTVTFGLPKIGNILYPGYGCCGKLFVSHISFPPEIYEADWLKIEINDPPALPRRDKKGHKGDFGEALFIAGASSYFGAPYFSALSFLKAGGGYSRLASPKSITPFLANKGSEIVFIPQNETTAGSISLNNKRELLDLSEKMDLVVIGPGISLEEETQQLSRELAREINKPLIIDGDGITALSKDLEIIRKRKHETILTPHLGEMSRITNMSVAEIDSSKVEVLQKTAKELNSCIVLKGAHSLIGYPDQRVFINMTGNSGMATAGSGDVLTGTIAAMHGLGLDIQDAARKGVFIHGLSGDLAAADKGEDGITAQDIVDYLPLALKADRDGLPEELRNRYKGAYPIG